MCREKFDFLIIAKRMNNRENEFIQLGIIFPLLWHHCLILIERLDDLVYNSEQILFFFDLIMEKKIHVVVVRRMTENRVTITSKMTRPMKKMRMR